MRRMLEVLTRLDALIGVEPSIVGTPQLIGRWPTRVSSILMADQLHLRRIESSVRQEDMKAHHGSFTILLKPSA
jgi:hypothetical protein